MAKDRDIDDAVKKLKKEGYRVRKPGNYKKTSVVVHEGTWKEFRECASKHGYLLQEAVTEAFDIWIETRKEENKNGK